MGRVVWIAGQKPSRKYRDATAALFFHYQRCFFGASYGMKGVQA